MLSLNSDHRYYLYNQACDMRKSFDGLSGLVLNELRRNPTDGSVYVFLNRRRTHIKLLHWEAGGFVLYYKRLEKGCFSRPDGSHSTGKLSWAELVLMIEGIEVKRSVQKPRYVSVPSL